MRVAAICGSLRRGSYNRLLLRSAIERAPEGLTFEEVAIRDFPPYDDDLAAEAFPEAVTAAKQQIQAADGLLLVTPEYNFGVPGVLKNAVDWLSRPYTDQTLRGKPTGVIGASTGWAGTVRAQMAWRQSFDFLKSPVFEGHAVHVSMAANVFDADGRLVNELLLRDLDTYLALFAAWLERIQCMG